MTTAERFWSKVDKSGDCWEWTGTKRSSWGAVGYGRFRVGGRLLSAHRFSYELANAVRLRDDALVLHRCDNPSCVRPDHLFLGTAKDNMQDMLAKGRANKERGEDRYCAKLSEDDVRSIRRLYGMGVAQSDIARFYPVKQPAVSCIVRGKTWGHVA